jgi:hypothetical protein
MRRDPAVKADPRCRFMYRALQGIDEDMVIALEFGVNR